MGDSDRQRRFQRRFDRDVNGFSSSHRRKAAKAKVCLWWSYRIVAANRLRAAAVLHHRQLVPCWYWITENSRKIMFVCKILHNSVLRIMAVMALTCGQKSEVKMSLKSGQSRSKAPARRHVTVVSCDLWLQNNLVFPAGTLGLICLFGWK